MENGYYYEFENESPYQKFNLWFLENKEIKLIGEYKKEFEHLSWKRNESEPLMIYNLIEVESPLEDSVKKFSPGLAKKLLKEDSPEIVKKILNDFFK
jgi:hypothetical protein